MKKSYLYFLSILFVFIPLLAFSAEFRGGEQPTIGSGEKITGDAYLGGGSVTSMGEVTGDLIVGGGNVLVSGTVGADLLAGGGSVTVVSNVLDDLRIAGGNIVIQGKVSGDVVIAGGQVTIGGSGVGGDVTVGAGSIRIDAPVSGKVKIAGGEVYINSPIEGEISIMAESVTLGKSAIIKGKLSYKANSELIKEDGAVVLGEIEFKPQTKRQIPKDVLLGVLSLWVIGKFLALFVTASVIGLNLKRYSSEVVSKAMERPMLEIGRGLLILLLLPLLSVLLIMTIIGAPLGLMGIIAFVSLLLFGWVISPIIVGSLVYGYFKKDETEISLKTIFIGVVVFKVLGLVPFFGFIFQVIMMLLSVGVIGSIKHQIVKEWR
ncbi:MAG: hypothetical protein WAX44_00560 [Minisyncoccia bacterium]